MQKQSFISITLVLLIATLCFLSSNLIDYRITALILLMTVSVLAVLFDIFPVLITAILSGLILNFLFIKPLFSFEITNTEDVLLFMMYIIIALVNAVLTFKIRESENKAREKARDIEEKIKTIKLYNVLLNSISHELRTPIATIIGAIDLLKEKKSTISEKNQEVLLDEIDKASIRLNQQVENLLNMSRLDTGILQLKKDWCDTNELINGVIQKLLPLSNNQILVFQPNENLPFFKLDTGLIEEIMHNIIYNALLYTPKNTIIKIDTKYEISNCIISVSDNGGGFPENEIQFVFDKFYRLQNSKSGGSGLGLSIVKGFVEAHNGTIELENNITGGAKFIIKLPVETSYLKNLKNE
ncbi:sensor histidine kinase [Flavobacterium araucananum]|uniref:histidine kinase n=1 Tax=Flavobacterium araucananum TaxID=946678 RepID=A0A227P185_9FLAO|nr:sensor histidine kinase [Flavobacterium araucananum]